jgi:hypothetical protein
MHDPEKYLTHLIYVDPENIQPISYMLTLKTRLFAGTKKKTRSLAFGIETDPTHN